MDAKARSTTLQGRGVAKINFLLLDHTKDWYLGDQRDLESVGLLTTGSHVSADSVVINRLDAYRECIQRLVGELVTLRLEEMNLEYSNNLKDGISKHGADKDRTEGDGKVGSGLTQSFSNDNKNQENDGTWEHS